MSKNKYIWKICEKHWSWFYSHISEKPDYYNIPIVRSKSRYRCYLRIQAVVKDYNDYKLKQYSKTELKLRDDWEDTRVCAWKERESWKRNSKRKHQWK